MSVSKVFRKQGIGRALLTELLLWTNENPLIDKVRLEVFDNDNNKNTNQSVNTKRGII
ncbi:GNAT family N-acetyltransferase [Peribacillus butanolivorans]|uniref:GNAT family N-acetyltransferase n=1 Tax=Peribacillus butanolivorans TaxID=421767 RepID=UPI00364A0990